MKLQNVSRRWTRPAAPLLVAAAMTMVFQVAGAGLAGASVTPRGPVKNYPYGLIDKSANSMKGLRITNVSCIVQFDGITGPKQFLAEWSDANDNSYNDYWAKLPSAAVGAHAYEGSLVRVYGYILGYYTYTDQDNSVLTIPKIEVTSLSVIRNGCE